MIADYRKVIFCFAFLIPLVSFQTLLAAPWEVGSKRLTKMNKAYDTKKIETITGEIVTIFEVKPSDSPNTGYHMIVKTEVEEIHIHLGPIWFINNQIIQLLPGDIVRVVAAGIKKPELSNGVSRRAVRASEVWKNDRLALQLRDKEGKPLWSGL